MRKKVFRIPASIGAFIISTSLLGGVIMPMSAYAADAQVYSINDAEGNRVNYSHSTINPNQKGSITLYKYEDNAGAMTEGDGQYKSKDQLNKQLGLTGNNALRPVSGVEFTATRIATIENLIGTATVHPGTYPTGTDTGRNTDKTGEQQVTGVYYTNIDQGFLDVAKQCGVVPTYYSIKTGNKTVNAYTVKDLEIALNAINSTTNIKDDNGIPGEVALVNYAKTSTNSKKFSNTNKYGRTELEGLDLGLYIVTETNYKPSSRAVLEDDKGNVDVSGDKTQNHQDIENPASPYLISLPMTNVGTLDGNAAGTVWQYDVTTFPKNQTTTITKKIISPDSEDKLLLEDYEDYDIGDTVKQVIYADIPVNLDLDEEDQTRDGTQNDRVKASYKARDYKYYMIQDEMSEGLTLDKVTRVLISPKVYNPVTEMDFENVKNKIELVEGKDYKASTDSRYSVLNNNIVSVGNPIVMGQQPTRFGHFYVMLTEEGLNKINSLTDNNPKQLVVYFDSELSPDAKIGVDDKNTNQASLIWSHTNTKYYQKYSNETRVYTYELDITKAAEKAGDTFDPSLTEFTVRQNIKDGHGYAPKEDAFVSGHKLDSIIGTNTGSTGIYRTLANANNLVSKDDSSTYWNDVALMKFIEEEPGVYHVFAPESDDASKATTIIKPAGINTKQPGKLQVKGLDSEVYTITERKTQDHYSLMKSSIDVDLTPETQTDTSSNTVLNGDDATNIVDNTMGNGATATDIYNNRTTDDRAANGLVAKHINGKLASAVVTTGDEASETNFGKNKDARVNSTVSTLNLTLGGTYNGSQVYKNASANGTNTGVASVTIKNNKVVTLRTGGVGTTEIYIVGVGLLALVVIGYALSKKKKL